MNTKEGIEYMEQEGGGTGGLLEGKTKSFLTSPSTVNAKIWHNGCESNILGQHPPCSSLGDALRSIPEKSVL